MQEGAIIVLREPSGAGQQWPLNRPVTTLGRLPGNDIVFAHREVSRHHARIRYQSGLYVLEDLDSTNGTFVNNRRLTGPVTLQDGDEIRLGPEIRLTFVDAESTLPMRVTRRQPIEIDEDRLRVWVDGVEISPPLSPPQFTLLQVLAEHPGRVFGRDEIIGAVWPDEAHEGVSDSAIDALVRRLRQRLAEVDPHHDYIVVARGYGFKLEVPGDDQ